MKQTNITLATILVIGLASTTVVSADTPPTTPTNLTAKIYSGAGGEIFWNRSTDDTAVSGYEVTVNGQIVGEFDALSYYDSTLQQNIEYAFTVTAIDSTGQRSASAAVTLGGTTMPGTTVDAPGPPEGLRASVYSSTSAELFWTRSSIPGLQYEVLLDGNPVATTDGISYYINNLSASRSYHYEVITIDNAGIRSASDTIITIDTSSLEPNTITTPLIPLESPPENNTLPAIQPQDISISIYSSTAAELFWTPAIRFRPRVFKNEIRRNNVLIATVAGESLRSYFDDDRIPGEDYAYEVTAVSSAGRGSATISDTDTQIMSPIDATITTSELPTDLRTKLDTTFEIINGVAVEKILATLGKLADSESRSSVGLVRDETGLTSEFDLFNCPNGGVLLARPSVRASDQRYSNVVIGTDCSIGAIVFNGRADIKRSTTADDSFSPSSVNARDIELEDSRDLSTITGDQLYFFFDEEDPRFSRWSSFDVNVDRPQNSYSYSFASGSGNDELNGLPDGTFGLTVNASRITGVFNTQATIRTLGPMEFTNGRENARPTAGRISFESETDNLLINASNGDPSTFTLTNTSDGSITSYTVSFSDTYRFEAPITEDVDLGF